MAKVHINGEVLPFDGTRQPMTEALEIEQAAKVPYEQYRRDLTAGSARAMCIFVWTVLKRNGRDVSLEDILSGEFEINMYDYWIEQDEDEEPGPTAAGGGSPPPATTTASSSPSSSESAPGRSGS
jgi:hypothetical protein